MAATPRDSLANLEAHRLRLEETIAQLRSSLRHWQVWDAEYETLKEEVEAITDPSPSRFEQIRDGFEAELVDAKEIGDIFGPGMTRTKEQIINVIDRRLDYVEKSIQSIQKNLESAENRHAAVSVISEPDMDNEEGLPMTEIVERLDEDDNVVSYQLNRPGEGLHQVREALEKAGVKDLSPLDEMEKKAMPSTQPSASAPPASKAQEKLSQTTATQAGEPSSSITVVPAPKKEPKKEPKKAVSFSQDTKSKDAADQPKSQTARRLEEIMKTAQAQEAIGKQTPVLPDDESPEDAAMRQEMLKYSMGEMSAVVAELELEEGETGDEDGEDYEFDSDEDPDDDDDEYEDQWGRSRSSVITDSYHKRMLELEKKLGITSHLGRQEEARLKKLEEDNDDSGSEDERVGRIRVNHSAAANGPAPDPVPTKPSAAKPPPAKSIIKERQAGSDAGQKGVKFSQSLDIAPEKEPQPSTQAPIKQESHEPVIEPLSDVIVERSAPSAKAVSSEEKPSRKASRFSRFKQSREGSQPDIPKGPFDVPERFIPQEEIDSEGPKAPEGKTIADTLHERESTRRPKPNDGEFDEHDEEASYGEVADEYQRMRRKFVYRQGGFLKEEDNPAESLSEDGPAPMSRFKAARLSKQ